MPDSVFIDSITNFGIAGVLAYIVYFQIKSAKETSDGTIKERSASIKVQEKHIEILGKIVERLEMQNNKLEIHNKLLDEFKETLHANTLAIKNTVDELGSHNTWSKKIYHQYIKSSPLKKLKKITT